MANYYRCTCPDGAVFRIIGRVRAERFCTKNDATMEYIGDAATAIAELEAANPTFAKIMASLRAKRA